MTKTIKILGKRNTDALTNVQSKRKISQEWQNREILLDPKQHVKMLNKLYLDESFNGAKEIESEFRRKLNSYKMQDCDKKKYDKDKFITISELKEKLVLSKLHCYYCKKVMLLMYEQPREKMQWTLDRINNGIGHHNDNVVISCLKCNLKKRTTDSEKFKFTKQMRIIKKF